MEDPTEIYFYNHRKTLRINVTPLPDAGPPPKVGETLKIRYGNLIDTEIGAIPVWEPDGGEDEWAIERIEKIGAMFTVDLVTYDNGAGWKDYEMAHYGWPETKCNNERKKTK